MSTKPLLKESLLILNISGVNPFNQTIWRKTEAITMIGLLIYMEIEIILQFTSNWKGWDSVDEFTICAGILQTLSKFLFMILKSKDFILAIIDIEKFWSWRNQPIEVREKIKQISERTMTCIKVYGIGFSLLSTAYALKPIFSLPLRTLPIDTYHPRDKSISPSFQLNYALQVIFVALSAIGVLGFDSLFLSFLVHAVCQLKIVKQRFAVMKVNPKVKGDEGSSLEEITNLVGHHNYVLRSIQNINNSYSAFLLSQFSSSIMIICCALLNIAASDFPPDPQRFSKCAIFLLCGAGQLFFYCFIGELLTAESESLSNAVYESDWWVKTQPKLRKSYVLIIQRAQKAEELSAGGMITLNLKSFTSIMKFALSFFAMAQAMYSGTGNLARNSR